MKSHIKVVAVLQIGLSIFGIIAAIIILVLMNTLGFLIDNSQGSFIMHLVGNFLAAFFFLMSAPGIIAGLGLLARKEWARILTIILGVIGLVNFPFGTAFGIYAIWVMVQEEVVQMFRGDFRELE